jgi:DNA-binding response OmpR family regulator
MGAPMPSPGLLEDHTHARVLVVDHREADLLERLLARRGLGTVRTTEDPRSVMGCLPDFDPDLVLMDLHLPHMASNLLLRQIRQWAGRAYLPVVVLTTDTRAATLLTAVDAGATDFLTKPLNATEILVRIRNLLDCRSLYLRLQHDLQPSSAAVPPPASGRDKPMTVDDVVVDQRAGPPFVLMTSAASAGQVTVVGEVCAPAEVARTRS